MKVIHWTDCEENQIDKLPYQGRQLDVIDTRIRRLSSHGEDDTGVPEYGLRFSISAGRRCPVKNSEPVDRHIGQLLLQIFIHQLLVPVFRKVPAAGPAAEKDLCSGPPDVKVSTAGRAFFFDMHGVFIHESAGFYK